MREPQFLHNEIRAMVDKASERGQDVCINIESLRFAFGFKRMDGEELMLRKLMTVKTEEQIQSLSKSELVINFENWCREVGISYGYDYLTDRYFLRKNEITTFKNM